MMRPWMHAQMRLCTRIRLDGEEVEVLDFSLVDHSHWEELEEQDPSVVHVEGWVTATLPSPSAG